MADHIRRIDENGKILNGCGKCPRKDGCECDQEKWCAYELGISGKYVFHFGQYKGKSVDEVIKTDPQYLLWSSQCIPYFELAQSVKDSLAACGSITSEQIRGMEIAREKRFRKYRKEEDPDKAADFGGKSDENEEL